MNTLSRQVGLSEAILMIQDLIEDTQLRMDEFTSRYHDQEVKDQLGRLQHMKSGMEASRDSVQALLDQVTNEARP